MISWLCGRRSIGKRRRWRSGDPVQPVAICGVSDEVNQVSKMSASPVKPPGWSRCPSSYPGGVSVIGSTGSAASSATIGAEKSVAPSAFTGYHTGKGTPK